MIRIWEPRWHDRVVLLAVGKVKPDTFTEVELTKSGDYNGVYVIPSDIIMACPKERIHILCYAVPLDAFVDWRVS